MLLIAGIRQFAETEQPTFFAYLALITAGLIAIYWRKGETPRWRWGDND